MPNENWLVSKWMSKDVISLEPNAPLAEVFDKMEANRIRHIPIVERGRLVGIVSDRDVSRFLPTRKALKTGSTTAYGKNLMEMAVEGIMTRDPLSVTPESSLREAAMIILREKVGALPVVEDERLIGILSAQDMLWAFMDNIDNLRNAMDMG